MSYEDDIYSLLDLIWKNTRVGHLMILRMVAKSESPVEHGGFIPLFTPFQASKLVGAGFRSPRPDQETGDGIT